ncbi:MAG TPA: M20 family metallopeptidase [Acidimicrobiales bacterium]|nr:M20 family metallopeptidase [Acidimicrobiales bacterium]
MRRHVDPDALVECARALVAVDTQNPPGNEQAALDVARKMLEPFGASFEEVEPAPGRTSLVATIGRGDGSRPTLIVNGHLDVVPVDRAGWTCDPFEGRLDGDRLYGRGMADMKGGIAAAVEALHAVGRSGREPACDIVFHLVADEERGGGLGTRALVEAGLVRGDACLVPEPTGMAVCVAERGLMVADVTVFGRPAHGSEPRRGVSAVEMAAKVVLSLHAADFGGPAHPLLGTPTCNVGVIEGGSGHNTVAERCTITVDRRLLPGVSRADAEAGLRRLIDSVDDPDLRYELEVSVYGEASELDPSHGLVGQVQAAMVAALGGEAEVIGMGFTTDARFVRNEAGIPAVVCGPGEVSQAHVNDEWVSVSRLVVAAAVYAELYATFSASDL